MKNHNIAWILDGETTDNELVERYNLDPSLAYTPKINAAVRQAVYDENIREMTARGIPLKDATTQSRLLSEQSLSLEKKIMSHVK